MTQMTKVSVAATGWTLGFTAATAQTIGVYSPGPGTVRIRIGAAATAGDTGDAPSEELDARSRVSFALAAGDKVFFACVVPATVNVWSD